MLRHGIAGATVAIVVAAIVSGVLLAAGLWTPLAGSLAAIVALWNGASHAVDLRASVLLATLGVSLALLGPGAYSVDAWLFGWKRIDVRDRSR